MRKASFGGEHSIWARALSVCLVLLMVVSLVPAKAFAADGDETSTVFKLVDTLTAGKDYLIVNANAAGSAYALQNNNLSIARYGVTIASGDIDGDGNADTYINTDNTSIVWSAIDNAGSINLRNGTSGYLEGGSGSMGIKASLSHPERSWSYTSDKRLRQPHNTGHYYLRYTNSNFSAESISDTDNPSLSPASNTVIYIFERTGSQGGTQPQDPDDPDEPGEPATGNVYKLAASFSAGKDYIIVNTNAVGTAYAFRNNSLSMSALSVDIKSGDIDGDGSADTYISTDETSIVWSANAVDGQINLSNNGGYLEGGSGSLGIKSSLSHPERGWTYSSEGYVRQPHKTGYYYLRYNNNSYTGESLNSGSTPSSGTRLYIFERTNAQGGDDPDEPQDPDEPSDVVYLAFTSDVHNTSANTSANRLNTWINTVSGKIGAKFDNMGFCGDMADANASQSNYWTLAQTVIDVVKNNANVIGNGFYVCGNHEYSPGNFSANLNDTTKNYSVAGTSLVTDDYILYSLGATQGNENYLDADINAMSAFLAAHNDFKGPIFILTHYPLHCYNGRTGESTTNHDGRAAQGTSKIIEVLNNYPNTIFLWGHNHSSTSDHYDNIYTDKINDYDINFTYAAAGAMSDSEYAGSNRVSGKGLVAAIRKNAVDLTYYDVNYNALAAPVTIDLTGGSTQPDDPDEPDEPAEGNIYKLVDTMQAGKEYLIVNTNEAGSAYALSNGGSSSLARFAVTIASGDVDGDGNADTYIDTDNTTVNWKTTVNEGGFKLTNGGKYLEGKSGNVNYFDDIQYTDRAWTYSGSQLKFTGSDTSTTYTLRYSGSNNNFTSTTSTSSSSSNNLYIFERTNAEGVEPHTHTASATWSSDANGHWHVCTGCGEKIDQAAHVSSGPATATQAEVCTVCGYEISPAIGEPAEGNIFKMVDTMKAGKEYIIVNTNAVGSAYAFQNNSGSMGRFSVSIKSGDVDGDGNTDTYIESDNTTIVWAANAIDGSINLSNNGGYLEGGSGSLGIKSSLSHPERSWDYTGEGYVRQPHNTGYYYLRYTNNNYTGESLNSGSTPSSGTRLYIFERTNAEGVEPHEHTASATWSSDANGHWHVCTGCGEKIDQASHVSSGPATATQAEVCTVCGYEISPAIGEPSDGTIYKLVDTMKAGKEYLIVNTNEAGSAYALSNGGSSSLARFAVTIARGDVDGDGNTDTYIDTDNTTVNWKAAANGSGFNISNGGRYLEGYRGNIGIYDSLNYADRYWTYSGNILEHEGSTSNTYILRYSGSNNNFTSASSSSSSNNNLYIFERTDAQGVEPHEHTASIVWSNDANTHWHVCTECGEKLDQAAHVSSGPATATQAEVCTVCGYVINPAIGEPSDGTIYKLVSSMKAGKEYLIVSTNAVGSAYALQNGGGSDMARFSVTVRSGDVDGDGNADTYIDTDNTTVIWKATANGSGFNLTNGGRYLEGKSGNVNIFDSINYADRYWTYSGSQLQHNGGQNTYTVYYSNGFTSTYNSTSNTIYIFERTNAQGGEHTHTASTAWSSDKNGHWHVCTECGEKIDQAAHVSSGPATATQAEVCTVCGYVIAPATGTEPSGDTIFVAFTSDVHNGTNGTASLTRLNTWIDTVTGIIGGKFDNMGFCGDMGPASGSSSNFWSCAQAVMDAVKNSTNVVHNGFFICGNHEYNPGNFSANLNDTTKNYSTPGTYFEGDGYYIYSLSARQWDERYSDSDIADLQSFLEAHSDFGGPIFILGHFPLHCYGRYTSGESTSVHDGHAAVGSAKIIALLNDYPNTFFIWGHNHSSSNDHYDAVYTDKINDTEINFTYAAAGSMSDSEYGQSGNVKGKGLVATITDGSVTLTYYGISGNVVGTPATIPMSGGGTPSVNYTITASAGSNGSIDPSGAVSVKEGRSKTFTFAPAAGYEVNTVTVDGAAVSVSGLSYTFENVRANHSINVTFKQASVTAFEPATTMTAGQYIVVSNGYALYNNNGTISAVPVTISGGKAYVRNSDLTGATWSFDPATGSDKSGDYEISNNGYLFTRVSDGSGTSVAAEITKERKSSEASGLPYYQWTYDVNGNSLSHIGGQDKSATFYAYYNTSANEFYTSTSENPVTLYVVSQSAPSDTFTLGGTVKSFRSETDTITVQLLNANGDVVYTTTTTGTTATYRIQGVAAGTYTLRVSKADHVTRDYTVAINSNNDAYDVEVWLLGDVNGDGRVNIGDYNRIYDHVLGTTLIEDDYARKCADANLNGRIDIGDYNRVYNHVLGTEYLW